jgi:hypothetical protein
VLQDFDRAAKSNLSTCLLLSEHELRTRKVRAVAQRLEAVGFAIDMVERRFGPLHQVLTNEPTTALFGVDNTAARRDIDSAKFAKVVEAGLGSGYRDSETSARTPFPAPNRHRTCGLPRLTHRRLSSSTTPTRSSRVSTMTCAE